VPGWFASFISSRSHSMIALIHLVFPRRLCCRQSWYLKKLGQIR
jgi:hypothetical protein